jgi:hypothetical protein
MARSDDAVEVLSGATDDGLRWVVLATGDDRDLFTLLRVYRGDELLVPGSGFGGPPLYPGSLLNEWRGRTDELPYFVMARTSPDVERVVATTDRGLDIELALSAPDDRFGLRFAAAALPEGHGPASIRAERGGDVIDASGQHMPQRPRR